MTNKNDINIIELNEFLKNSKFEVIKEDGIFIIVERNNHNSNCYDEFKDFNEETILSFINKTKTKIIWACSNEIKMEYLELVNLLNEYLIKINTYTNQSTNYKNGKSRIRLY
jgi:hypothetical protein